MKKLVLIILLLKGLNLFAQGTKNTDTGGYERIPGSGHFVKKSEWSKYLKFDGAVVVDVRTANNAQLKRINNRARIAALTENRFWGLYHDTRDGQFPRRSLSLRFQQHTGAKIYQGNSWKWGTLYKNTIIISGKSEVEVVDALITPENAKNFRYRIIQNDNKELQRWSTPTTFKRTDDGKYTYCLLANLTYKEGQFIQVELYNINNYRDRDAIIVDWRPTRKLAFWTTVDYRKKAWGSDLLSVSLGNDKEFRYVNFIATDTLTDIKFRLGDSLVRLGFRSHNLATSYNYQINFKRIVDGKMALKDLGTSDGIFFLYKEFWDKPGQYEITFTPKLSNIGGRPITYVKEEAVTYKFTVLPELYPNKTFSQREMVIFGLILALCFFALIIGIIVILKKIAAKKLAKQIQQKELVRLQLSSVRSQLNPHFMFNALAGIQNLMNKNKMEDANNYLSKFARLTRSVLDQQELISLAEEKSLLEDYLQMEQFRFGFKYIINVGETLDLNNIEIPAMLLQPFLENAVKHGIAEKENEGEILISFNKRNRDLVLEVKDNGQGFDYTQNYDGLGLQLSKNRITLLNTIYKETSVVLLITATIEGTTINITLTDWL